MRETSVLETLSIIAVIVFTVFHTMRSPTIAQAEGSSALEFFQSRPVWNKLPIDFLKALAERLETAETASDFAELCETTGILQNNIVEFSSYSSDSEWLTLTLVAMTLTNYANQVGAQRQMSEAREAAELALLLVPKFVPAWAIMAQVAYNTGDCSAAVSWADRVLNFKPDPASTDAMDRIMADVVAIAQELLEMMRNLKEACGQ